MTVRTIIDLEQLSTDTVALITRALAEYSRSTPADRVTAEFLDVVEAVLEESKSRAGRRNPIARSRQEATGSATPVAGRGDVPDGAEVPIYLTRSEYALRMGVSVRTVDRLIGRGEIVGCVRLGRSVRIPIDATTPRTAPGATA